MWSSLVGVTDSTDAIVVSITELLVMNNDDVATMPTEFDRNKEDACNWDVLMEDTSVAVGIKVGVGHWFKSATHWSL